MQTTQLTEETAERGRLRMLLGQYDYTIDAKGRLNFPARFREEMGARFIVTKWMDGALAAFTAEEFARVADELAEKSGIAKGRKIQLALFASAIEVEPDKQGRILLPATLRTHAALERDVTIVGSRNHAEIWSTDRWNECQLGSDALTAAMEALDL